MTRRLTERVPTVLTTKDVARRFRVHPNTVRRWANSGRLHCFHTFGGHARFTLADVENALREETIE